MKRNCILLFFLIVIFIISCQYENETDLYYSNMTTDSLYSGLLAHFTVDKNLNDESGNDVVLTAYRNPGYTHGHDGESNTAIMLDGKDDFLVAYVGAMDTFSISMWVKSNISYAYDKPWHYPVLYDYSNKQVYSYLDGSSGATKVVTQLDKQKIIIQEKIEGMDWTHLYVSAERDIQIYINGRSYRIYCCHFSFLPHYT